MSMIPVLSVDHTNNSLKKCHSCLNLCSLKLQGLELVLGLVFFGMVSLT